MGRADHWLANEFRILGGAVDEVTGRIYIEHTVGELLDIAQYLRDKPTFDTRELSQRKIKR
jgi:hypothetical protein